jgi:hypothetical protein
MFILTIAVWVGLVSLIFSHIMMKTIVPFLLDLVTHIRLVLSISWLVLLTSNLAATYFSSNSTVSYITMLSSSIQESAASPYSYIGLCSAMSYITGTVIRLVLMLLDVVGSEAIITVHSFGAADLIIAVSSGIDIYCFGISPSENVHLIFLIMPLLALPGNLYAVTEPRFTTFTAGRHWTMLHVKALAVYLLISLAPVVVVGVFCVVYGPTHWAFVTPIPCLLVPIRVVRSVVQQCVEEYDVRNHGDTQWTNVDKVVSKTQANLSSLFAV